MAISGSMKIVWWYNPSDIDFPYEELPTEEMQHIFAQIADGMREGELNFNFHTSKEELSDLGQLDKMDESDFDDDGECDIEFGGWWKVIYEPEAYVLVAYKQAEDTNPEPQFLQIIGSYDSENDAIDAARENPMICDYLWKRKGGFKIFRCGNGFETQEVYSSYSARHDSDYFESRVDCDETYLRKNIAAFVRNQIEMGQYFSAKWSLSMEIYDDVDCECFPDYSKIADAIENTPLKDGNKLQMVYFNAGIVSELLDTDGNCIGIFTLGVKYK